MATTPAGSGPLAGSSNWISGMMRDRANTGAWWRLAAQTRNAVLRPGEVVGAARSLRHRLAVPIGVLVSVAAIYGALRSVNMDAVLVRLSHADPLPLVTILGVISVELVLRTVRWRALLAIASPPAPIRLQTLLPVLLIGYLGNTVLPARLGEPIRALLAARAEHLDPGVVFGTVVLERVLDTASLAGLAFGAALVLGAPAWLIQATGIVAIAGVTVVAALLAGCLGRLGQALVRAEGRLPSGPIASAARFIHFVAAGADAAQERPAAALALGISATCWLLDATTFWLVGQSLGVALAPGTALMIAAVTVLGTALPSAPGYLGTFELAAAGTATALGVPASAAFSLAVLGHAITVGPSALGGAVALRASGAGITSLSREVRAVRREQATTPEQSLPRPPAGDVRQQGGCMDRRCLLTGWGRTSPSVATVHSAGDDAELARLVIEAGRRGVLARGLGRSYGDAAQNGGGIVVDMTARNRVLSVDTGTALVSVEVGASLDQLMRLLLPLGLFVPVSPGTRHVTVGGAIAADIHGKNHHLDGSFGRHVVAMDLLCADGTIRRLTPESDLFWATVGGMGLTGLVVRATLRMKKVESAYCLVDTERCADLDDLLGRMAESDQRYTYSVAWIDCLARGASLGRSVLTRGWSATVEQLPRSLRDHPLRFQPRQLAVAPSVFPSGVLNRATVAAFNEAWYRKAPRARRGEIQGIAKFFHPLDAVAQWNRIYGPRGFLQYQFVVPFGAEDTLRRCIQMLSDSGQASFLAVLKRFGQSNPGYLSFPTAGWTLALDMPVGPTGLGRLLDRLDEEVLAAGGRAYLAKDSRLAASAIGYMYPRLDAWRDVRRAADPHGIFTSDLARRLGL